MDGLVQIVGEGITTWEDEPHDTSRYSIFTQNLMLADKVSKGQHLSPRSSKFKEADERSFHSADSRPPSIVRADSPTIPEDDVLTQSSGTVLGSPPSRAGTTPANIGRPRTAGRRTRQVSQSSSGDWTWRPSIPQRVSSMDTRRKKGSVPCRPDLATFHRRSCQLFSSLDTALSNANANGNYDTGSPDGSRTSTSPSLASSISTQATSILDDNWYTTPAFPSFHLELQNPGQALPHRQYQSPDFSDFISTINHTPRVSARRSSSQLSPHITSTEPMFWTSDATRQLEYAKIDAAHSGFKGFVKRMLPRRWGWAHGKRRNFHQKSSLPESQDGPDVDVASVRRFRMSIASATQEAIRGVEEHGVSAMNSPIRCTSPSGVVDDAADIDLDVASSALANDAKFKSMKRGPVNKVLAKVRSSDALAKMFRSHSNKVDKAERRAKTLSRDFGY